MPEKRQNRKGETLMGIMNPSKLRNFLKRLPYAHFDNSTKIAIETLITKYLNGEIAPVVRCKDCRDYKPNPYSEGNEKLCMCWADWIPTEPDDFCSCGERKEDA
jgi:hypothetical protein